MSTVIKSRRVSKVELYLLVVAMAIFGLFIFPILADAEADEGRSVAAAGENAGQGHLVPASEVIGSEVRNQDNEEVGEVEDLIIDGETGQIPFAVVAFEGEGLLADDRFAIPWKAFSHKHEDGACVLNVGMMSESPEDLQKDQWGELDREGAVDENDALIGDYWVEASTSEDQAAVGPRSRALSANNLLGAQVYNRGGEEVGELQNLVVDFDKGQIVNTVFATGGILGVGEDEYLLPWKSFSHSREEGRLMADITKEKVESSPRYDEEDYDHERSDRTTR